MADTAQYEATATDKAKGIRYGLIAGQWKPIGRIPPVAPENYISRIMGKTTGISAYHPKIGLAGVEEKLGDLRQRLSESASRGTTQATGDLVASLPLGLLRILKGGSELLQGDVYKVGQATKDIVGGGLEASTIPSMFVAPETSGIRKSGELGAAEAAKYLTDAVNPLPRAAAGYQKALAEHLDKVLEFAKSKNLPMNTLDDFANALKTTGKAIQEHYYKNVLGPVKDMQAAAGSPTTLGQLDNRLSEINAELNPKFARGGVTGEAAVKSATELTKEAAGIRKVLYEEVAKHTGNTPETIASMRSSFGSLRDLADKTELSAAKARYAKNAAQRGPITLNPFSASSGKQFIADKAVNALRGNPVDRAIRQVLSRTQRMGYSLPESAVTTGVRASARAAPIRDVGEGIEIGVKGSSAAERGSVPAKLAGRREANALLRKREELKKAEQELQRILKESRHPFWKGEMPE
jgi:hypothetical protein